VPAARASEVFAELEGPKPRGPSVEAKRVDVAESMLRIEAVRVYRTRDGGDEERARAVEALTRAGEEFGAAMSAMLRGLGEGVP
jgi:hypothetical protein